MDERPTSKDGNRRRNQHHFESIYGQRADPRRGGWKNTRSQPQAHRLPQTLPPIDAPPPVPPQEVLQENEFPDPNHSSRSRSNNGRRPAPARVLNMSNGAGWGAPKHATLAPLQNQPVPPPMVASTDPQRRRPQPKGLRNVFASAGSSSESGAEAIPEDSSASAEAIWDQGLLQLQASFQAQDSRAEKETAPAVEAVHQSDRGAASDARIAQESLSPKSELRASAKSVSVAALQKFFFEELAKGNDANGAAAQALLRLNESGGTPPVSGEQDSRGRRVYEDTTQCTDQECSSPPRQPTPLVGGNRSQAIRVSDCL